MGSSSPAFSQTFLDILRDMGGPRLNLEQVLRAYQLAFPADTMKPDMRNRLHDAIYTLVNAGILSIPEGSLDCYQNQELPKIVEIVTDRVGAQEMHTL
ncbi:hypothetical protein V5T82_03645 [Magnetovibrio sp. PR-2]|uniref:hypothetical protein n=1 Tax=Magnetovibrio sp. PR-2 TaxID=3120356 RepID=UPI002FCDF62C